MIIPKVEVTVCIRSSVKNSLVILTFIYVSKNLIKNLVFSMSLFTNLEFILGNSSIKH